MALILITAPSGTGKTSIMEQLAKQMLPKNTLVECISNTTRKMREGEEDGVTYYFTSKDYFKEGIDINAFAEYIKYDGHYYGIAKEEIKKRLSESKHAYIIVNYDGYKQVKEAFPDAVGIFLHMSKEDCMANMLLRGDSLENANKRIALYDEEMKNRFDYDYVVKNVRHRRYETARVILSIMTQYE